MGISVFPTGGEEFVVNDFVIDMNDTSNNVAELAATRESGSYTFQLSSGDTSFDLYVLDADGNSVGYTNTTTLIATAAFTTVVILGVPQDEVLTFTYNGAFTNPTAEGTEGGAGAYLVSINPSDLPNIDDTTNVVGGNFATDVEIYFESGTVSTVAKNITRSDSTALIVTRPDVLDPNLDPWDVKAINPGVTPPTGTNAHILAGTVDAGATPVWVTTSPLTQGTLNAAYTETLEATDADGSVTYAITAGSLPTGLSLNSSSGVISGTPTTSSETFTVQATDEGGNSNDREFNLPIPLATGGSISTDGNYTVHTFTSSADFVALASIPTAEFVVLAGGGGGGSGVDPSFGAGGGGGGGGGGYRTSFAGETSGGSSSTESTLSLSPGTLPVVVGAGGARESGNPGSDSSFSNITSDGGGAGGQANNAPTNGGSGGGQASNTSASAGSGVAGQGTSGGNSTFDANVNTNDYAGGGGGSQNSGVNGTNSSAGDGGAGLTLTGQNSDFAAGGGGASQNSGGQASAGGASAGDGGVTNLSLSGGNGSANLGGGGGGGPRRNVNQSTRAGNGGSGRVMIRYEA